MALTKTPICNFGEKAKDFNLKSIEWLYLAARGHRRAYFNLNKKQLEKKWLIP